MSQGTSVCASQTQNVSSQRAHFRVIAVTSPQGPAALAQIDDLRRMLRTTGYVSRARRVEIVQTGEHLLEIAALVEHLDGKFQVLEPMLCMGAPLSLG